MKIYIHYHDDKPSVRLFNVLRVTDAGPRKVNVAILFTDNVVTHDNVKRIVIEPEEE